MVYCLYVCVCVCMRLVCMLPCALMCGVVGECVYTCVYMCVFVACEIRIRGDCVSFECVSAYWDVCVWGQWDTMNNALCSYDCVLCMLCVFACMHAYVRPL